MESIITDIVKIIKSENNVIAREKALMCYFFNLIRELIKLALEEVDAGLVEKTKNWGRASFWNLHGIKYLNVMGWMQGAGDGTFYGPHTENGQPVLVIGEGAGLWINCVAWKSPQLAQQYKHKKFKDLYYQDDELGNCLLEHSREGCFLFFSNRNYSNYNYRKYDYCNLNY